MLYLESEEKEFTEEGLEVCDPYGEGAVSDKGKYV